jgi:hypothetical protein
LFGALPQLELFAFDSEKRYRGGEEDGDSEGDGERDRETEIAEKRWRYRDKEMCRRRYSFLG